MIVTSLKRLSARAASGVPARAARTRKPSRSSPRQMRQRIFSSPPKRWSQPVMSSIRPCGSSSATSGEKRSHIAASLRSRRWSPASSASATVMSGTLARASASARPGLRPSSWASGSTAARRSVPTHLCNQHKRQRCFGFIRRGEALPPLARQVGQPQGQVSSHAQGQMSFSLQNAVFHHSTPHTRLALPHPPSGASGLLRNRVAPAHRRPVALMQAPSRKNGSQPHSPCHGPHGDKQQRHAEALAASARRRLAVRS